MNRGKVLITGAPGYVGRHVVAAVTNAGYEVRALLREGSNPRVIHEYVDDLYLGNVTDERSLDGACDGCAAVIHLVGVINEKEGSFEDIHVKGTRNLLAEAERAGVRRFVYLSGLGTRPDAVARYHRTKYAAEQSVRAANLEGYCFPASVIFGPEDEFLNLFVGMAKSCVNPPWPIMPAIAGGHSRLQPVWVEDVAEALARSLAPDFPLPPGTYELGGPEPMTVREIMTVACKAAGRERIFVTVPLFAAQIIATFMEIFSSKPQLTRDQLIMVMEDGAAKHNMTERILGRPARSLWDYACEQFRIPGPHPHRVVVGAGCYNDRARPQAGILWTPPEKKEEKK